LLAREKRGLQRKKKGNLYNGNLLFREGEEGGRGEK